jgi:hypothetical protein
MAVHDVCSNGENQHQKSGDQNNSLSTPPVIRSSWRPLNLLRTARRDSRSVALNLCPTPSHFHARGKTIRWHGFGYWSDEPIPSPRQSFDESWITG